MDSAWPSSIDIDIVGTKSGDFELKFVLENNDDAEFRADRMRPPKNLLHFFRKRVCGDVDIFWLLAAQQIPYTTSGEISNMPSFAQTRANFARRLFHRIHAEYCSGGLLPSHIDVQT